MSFGPRFAAVVLGLGLALTTAAAWAGPVGDGEVRDRTELTPKRAQGVDVVEHLGAQVPTALAFQDENGRDILYGDAVRGNLPTILTMNYSDCPMLCSLQLKALVTSLKQLKLSLGKDYRVVTVSLDPKETPDRLRAMKSRYLSDYGRPDVGPNAWVFLRGSDENVHAVARGLGFAYNYNEARDEYVHPAVFAIAAPDGKLSRYLYGLEYHPETVKLSLVEASQGKVGSTMDRLILFCFHYDASEGRYAPMARNIMKLASGATAVALAGLIFGLFRAERKRKAKLVSSGVGSGEPGPTSSSKLVSSVS